MSDRPMIMTVQCPSCSTSFPVDPDKVPHAGVSARCSVCAGIFRVEKPQPVGAGAEAGLEHPAGTSAPAEWSSPEVSEEPAEDVWTGEEEPAGEVWTEVEAEVEVEAEPDWEADVSDPPLEAWDADMADPVVASTETTTMDAVADAVADAVVDVEPVAEAEELPADEVWIEPPEAELEESDALDAEPSSFDPAETEPPSFDAPVATEPEPLVEADAPADAPLHSTPVESPFGKRDPHKKAQQLARVLVSDMIMYNPERHGQALEAGTLVADFEEEIKKSWDEYVEQVGEELARGTSYFSEALNELLARGEKLFPDEPPV